MAEISIQERQDLAIALLSVWSDQHQALRESLTIKLPEKPGIAATDNDCTAFWIGPNNFLLVSNDTALVENLRDIVDTEIATVSDLSHARIAMRITGSVVRQVLAKGLPVDLHPRVFPAHSVAVSTIHGFDVLVHLAGEPEDNIFELYASCSYAVDFRHWINDAALEFGKTA